MVIGRSSRSRVVKLDTMPVYGLSSDWPEP
jgi:hypothetical protein